MSADQKPAEMLRAAAAKVRETGKGVAYAGPWSAGENGTVWSADVQPYGTPCVAFRLDDRDAAWIALVHPGMAEHFAELLEQIADDVADSNSTEHMADSGRMVLVDEFGLMHHDWTAALAVARVVLGESPEEGS